MGHVGKNVLVTEPTQVRADDPWRGVVPPLPWQPGGPGVLQLWLVSRLAGRQGLWLPATAQGEPRAHHPSWGQRRRQPALSLPGAALLRSGRLAACSSGDD